MSPKPPMVMRSHRFPQKLYEAAMQKAEEREENVSDVLREALERYVAPPPVKRSVDPCPHCGAKVDAITANHPGHTYTEPCGHRVDVTMWPDRVELQRR